MADWEPRYRVINLSTGVDELECDDLGLAVTLADDFRRDSVEARTNHHFAVIKSEIMFSTKSGEPSNG